MCVNQEATCVQNECSRDENVEVDCGKTRNDRIRNEDFRELFRVASIGDKIREIHLRWFGNVQRERAATLMTKAFSM